MTTRLILIALLAGILAAPCGAGRAGRNLLRNGSFEKGLNDDGEPKGWHTRITGIIPVPEYEDPQNKKGRTGVVDFRCGCDRFSWGRIRPWSMLTCPECGRINLGLEDSGALYQRNDDYVQIARQGRRRFVRFDLPEAVGNVQGVRIVSHLVRAEPDAGYEISGRAVAEGAHLRVFVEGLRTQSSDPRVTEWLENLPPEANPLKQKVRLKRVFRKQVNVGRPTDLTIFGRDEKRKGQFIPPERSRFDVMFVSLYAYLPGRAAFDDIVLRKLTRKEYAALKKLRPGPKDRRLR